MTKHEALKDLTRVLRDTPVRLPRVESGPAPLTPAQKFLNSNQQGGQSRSGLSLLGEILGTGSAGQSSGSLLDELLGGGQTGSQGGLSGFGLSPLVSGLASLFGGGKSSPPPLALYSAPLRQNLQAGIQGGVVSGADSNQSGQSRTNTTGGQPQITLHVQAMDTQSILNRSTDIAQAVRQAMLQSHPINDVVADL